MKRNNLTEKIHLLSMVKSTLKVFTLVILILFTGLNSLTAQIKIYIETDLEGVSGVYKFYQTREKVALKISRLRIFYGRSCSCSSWS